MNNVTKMLGLAFIAMMMTACVFQPVHIDVYVPTQATLTDSTVTLDTSKSAQRFYAESFKVLPE
jgi:hypothetical protein